MILFRPTRLSRARPAPSCTARPADAVRPSQHTAIGDSLLVSRSPPKKTGSLAKSWLRTWFALGACLGWNFANATPPYSGTIFIQPPVITAAGPNAIRSVSYIGRGMRRMYDRRCHCFADDDAYLFHAAYADGLSIEVEVDPEYGSVAAATLPATFYATAVGHLPHVLRTDVHMLWIHKGNQPFGGGNESILIHTGTIARSYIDSGILEDALAHEAAHTSLDAEYAASPRWLAAQAADHGAISTYAEKHPRREDIAESFLAWLYARHGVNRIGTKARTIIQATIPHRLAFFDARHFDLYPYRSSR